MVLLCSSQTLSIRYGYGRQRQCYRTSPTSKNNHTNVYRQIRLSMHSRLLLLLHLPTLPRRSVLKADFNPRVLLPVPVPVPAALLAGAQRLLLNRVLRISRLLVQLACWHLVLLLFSVDYWCFKYEGFIVSGIGFYNYLDLVTCLLAGD
jgi:hypothetical protein